MGRAKIIQDYLYFEQIKDHNIMVYICLYHIISYYIILLTTYLFRRIEGIWIIHQYIIIKNYFLIRICTRQTCIILYNLRFQDSLLRYNILNQSYYPPDRRMLSEKKNCVIIFFREYDVLRLWVTLIGIVGTIFF